MSNKNSPVDLVVATVLDDYAAAIEQIDAAHVTAALDEPRNQEAIARDVLCKLSHRCGLPVILAALRAAGAPAELAEIRQRLRASIDARAASRQPGTDPNTKNHERGLA